MCIRDSAMRFVLHKIDYAGKDVAAIGPVDPLLVGRPHVVYEPSGSQQVEHTAIL